MITPRLIDPPLERGYLGLEFLVGLPGARLGAIELGVHALAQAVNLRLKFRLARASRSSALSWSSSVRASAAAWDHCS